MFVKCRESRLNRVSNEEVDHRVSVCEDLNETVN